jgi:hypothetical protein
MAITANFYSFSKRANETKKPTGTSYNVDVLLKEPCDLEAPSIEVHDASILSYNYCYIAFTGRYYFVDSRESIAKDTYLLTLREDYAASHIDEAKGQSVFAVMSSYAYETSIDDERCVPTENITRDVVYHNCEVMAGTDFAYEFLSVVNNNGRLSGIDVFYGIQGTLGGGFLQACSDINWLQQLGQAAGQVSPLDYVNSYYLCPFDPDQCHGTGSNTADLLGVQMSGNCIVDTQIKKHHEFFTIPRPSVSDFRYADKYVKYYMNLPCLGVTTLPTTLLRHADVVRVDYAADCLSGTIVFKISAAGICLGYYSTSMRQDMPMSRQGNRTASAIIGGTLGGLVSAAAGAKTGGVAGAVAGGIGGVWGGFLKGAYSMPDGSSVMSSSGSLAVYGARGASTDMELWLVESESDVDPSTFAAVAGRPTQKIITIQNGYLQTRNASVALSGTASEIDAFNALLDGGLYVN